MLTKQIPDNNKTSIQQKLLLLLFYYYTSMLQLTTTTTKSSESTNNRLLMSTRTFPGSFKKFQSKGSDNISEPGSDKSFDKITRQHDATLECKRTKLRRNKQLQAISMFRV